MNNDPYSAENRFDLSSVAGNVFVATASDTVDLPVGVKAVDIENQGTGWQRVDLVPVNAQPAGRAVSFFVPPNSVRPVPLRVQRVLLANIGANIRVLCYTDGNVDGSI
ncbi:MAG: hypothetical protein B7Y35_06045 [Sphingomonadales bacterium 28-64-96]|nr:MAG: hypothetical protein B7Y35_06045 [Sphingomonadales bacterium 28-64-96]